jgi:Major Facilitator Superfamily
VDQQTSYRALLRVRGLLALIVATALSRLAGRMFSLTLVLFVLARFSSPVLAGWLTFVAIAPGLALSPVAGAVLDRAGPTTGVMVDLGASAVLITAISIVGSIGWAHPPALFALVLLFSLTSPLGASGIRTLLPRLVPETALDRVNALDTAIFAIVDVLGPGLAGVAVAWLGPERAMLVIAAAYLGAALSLWRVERVPGLGRGGTSLWHQTVEGVVVVVRQPTLRGLALSYSLYQVTWGVLVVVVPVFAAEHFALRTGRSVAGLMWAATGLAGGAGALVAGHVRTAGRERRIMAAGMVVTALAAWPVAASFGAGGLVIGLMLAGVVSGPIDVALLTLRQRRTDPRQLGRVLSISMGLNLAGFPLGSAIGGMLVTTSLPATFVVAGLASVMAAVATLSIPER